MALEITDKNIAEITAQDKITLIDFWAPWCGPCRMIAPIIDQISEENTDINIGKMNVDENPESPASFPSLSSYLHPDSVILYVKLQL